MASAKIDPNSAVYATDEYGRPFIIVREGQQKSRLHGLDAIRVREYKHALSNSFFFDCPSFSLTSWLLKLLQASSNHLWDQGV